jgi:quercetin dioxygenase-like cupin family protein
MRPALLSLTLAVPGILSGHGASAQVKPFPASFHTRRIATNGTTLISIVIITALAWLVAAPAAMAQASAGATPLHWQVPPLLPPGARLAVVTGDPTAAVETTMLVSMPDGYRFPPHFHPSFEHVEVKQGTLLAGIGDQIDPHRTQALTVGDSATAPAGMHHFSIAKGQTLLSVTFMGPYTITYLRAEDAPRPRNFPFGY